MCSRLETSEQTARRARAHLGCSVHATVLNVRNAAAGSVHSKVSWTEKQACGHCHRTRLRNAIEVHRGGPDLSTPQRGPLPTGRNPEAIRVPVLP